MEITNIVNQYYADLQRDGREDNEENLRAWLWFTCPAQLRREVDSAIQERRKNAKI
jgi:hypothetical protein